MTRPRAPHVVVVLALGCSGQSAGRAPDSIPPAIAEPARGEVVVRRPCPEQAALRAALAKAWRLDERRIQSDVRCAAGRFPSPGWVVHADLATPDGDAFHRLAIVGADGAAIAVTDGDPGNDRLLGIDAIERLAAHDLDGDGIDEVVGRMTSMYRFTPTTTDLVVYAVSGGDMKLLLRRRLGHVTSTDLEALRDIDAEPQPLCEGTYELRGSSLVVRGTILSRTKDTSTCVDGIETYVLDGGVLQQR